MIPCLFSVSYAGLWRQHKLDLPGFIQRAADLGYPAVELIAKRPHLSPLDWDDSRLLDLRHQAAGLGVEIASLRACTDFTMRAAARFRNLRCSMVM